MFHGRYPSSTAADVLRLIPQQRTQAAVLAHRRRHRWLQMRPFYMANIATLNCRRVNGSARMGMVRWHRGWTAYAPVLLAS